MIAIFLLIVYIFLCYGASNIVVFSNGPIHVFDKLRKITNKIHPMLGEIFSCMMCFPTWVGIGLSAIDYFLLPNFIFTPFNLIFTGITGFWGIAFMLLMDGILASGTTWFIHNIEEWFESNSKYE